MPAQGVHLKAPTSEEGLGSRLPVEVQIKAADDKQPLIDALTALLDRPQLLEHTRRQIEREIRQTRSGLKAEQDAAYEIEFYFRDSRNVMTIHDLRIECGGRVAQIDHVIIDPFFEIWLCESKSFASGVTINEQGEWSTYWDGRPRGMPSPIEQNVRHVVVLGDVIAKGLVSLPRRSGVAFRPSIKSLVLISKGAHISRPKGWAASRVEGLSTVIKSDQLYATISRTTGEKDIGNVSRTPDERKAIENLARQLAALHVRLHVDQAARFGLGPEPVAGRPNSFEARASAARASSAVSTEPQIVCESCREPVPDAVVRYCRANAVKFRGVILCVGCQRRLKATHS